MSFDFSIKTRGIEELDSFFKSFPKHVRGIVAEAASDDLIGTPQRGLQHYPAYKHVTRASVFRPPYKSDKQRRFVMAGIRSGRIQPGYPHRTGNYQRGWERTGSGVSSRITGNLPHEGFPNKLAKRVGWKDPMDIISNNMPHAAAAAERAVQKYFAQKGMA
jgi:hypothetical protein